MTDWTKELPVRRRLIAVLPERRMVKRAKALVDWDWGISRRIGGIGAASSVMSAWRHGKANNAGRPVVFFT